MPSSALKSVKKNQEPCAGQTFFFFFFCFFFVFFFFWAGWLACWLGVQKDCQSLWQIGSESCDMKIRIVRLFEADTLPSHPSFSSSLPLFSALFSFMSDLTSSWTIPSNKMDKTSQPTTPELQVLYLLTSLPTELLTKPDWQWCVCMCVCVCVCFFLCFWVCLSLYF